MNTTKEEDRKRKKDKKDKKHKKKRREDEEIAGYSNTANPWGDNNLTNKFVWKLKTDKELSEGRDSNNGSVDRERQRQEEVLQEIEKVKKRRQERDIEKQKWEEERARVQREKDMLEHADWEKKDNQFFLQQAKTRSEIRIREGRPKPIDIIYKNLQQDPNFKIDINEPHRIFKGLPLAEMEELKKDISMYQELDSGVHEDFWKELTVVCNYRLDKLKNNIGMNEGVHQAVNKDIKDLLKGKTYSELCALETQINEMIASGSAVDGEYWESVLKKSKIFKAKARLRELHAQLVQQREAAAQQPSSTSSSSSSSSSSLPPVTSSSEKRFQMETIYADEDETDLHKRSESNNNSGNSGNSGNSAVSARKLMLEREAERLRSRGSNGNRTDEKMLTEDEMYNREAAMAMEESEEVFNTEFILENKSYSWHDRYRPRKPKFFNRVHTGYEWNKYNQTHYDHDNPPPKIVQGYKFNIFYPDLIDTSKAPQYFISPSPESPDYVILRFHAGPPYEDIAFTIANKEWEYSHKKGFKCTFERGILHLWFQFKRYRYRR